MKVLFVSSGSCGQNQNILVDKQSFSLSRQGIEVENFYISKKGIIGYITESFRLRKFLPRDSYLIHAHYGWCGVTAYIAKLFSHSKLVVSFMGDDLIGEVGNNGRYTHFGVFTATLNKILSKYVYDYTIVKSKVLADKLFFHTNYEIIPNGVDLKQFFPVDKSEARRILNLDQNKIYLLFAANPNRNEKNYTLSKCAFEKLGRDNVELLVIYDKSAMELNLFFNAIDCLLFSSIHEGSPNVIKEAMVCNCPIVSTNVGDVKWIFGRTEGCYLSSYKIDDFAEKIRDAIEFSNQKKRTKGRERVIEIGLDSEAIALKIIDVYKKILREN